MVAIPAPETIDRRFAQLIQQFGLTKNSFAVSLGKTASVVQHLIDGRNKPGFDLLCKVFEIYPNVSRDWLLLGRGPMLVGGALAPKPLVNSTPAAVEIPLEPIDVSEFDAPTARRPSPGVAGSRLQPAEIAATLALAAAAQMPTSMPAYATAPALNGHAVYHSELAPQAAATASVPAEAAAPHPVAQLPVSSLPLPAAPPAFAAPAEVASPAPLAQAPAAVPSPEIYVAAALHAQHLQHQLALSELRNQHLQEQQQMLREMLAMARQGMV